MNKEPETINAIQDQIVEEFAQYEDWLGKYEVLIEYSKSLPMINDDYKKDTNLVTGCTSRVWLHAACHDEKVYFTADSDAIITKGLVALIIKILSGHSPREITDADLFFIEKIGLREHLTPNRANGLTAMIKQMKKYASGFENSG